MSAAKPLISVIIPFHNRITTTCQAIESVLTQTWTHFEILLIDDGSRETLDPIQQINDKRLKIISQPNLGPAAARNAGIRAAGGDFIAFLDSDDLFMPDKLAVQVESHLSRKPVAFSHTNYTLLDMDGELIHAVDTTRYAGRVYPWLFYDCPIHISTFMAHRSHFREEKMFVERYRISEDIIFFSSFAEDADLLAIPQALTKVFITDTNHSRRPDAQIKGASNILDFLKRSGRLSGSNKRLVRARLYVNMALNYLIMRRIPQYMKAGLHALALAPFRSTFVSRSISMLQPMQAIRKRLK